MKKLFLILALIILSANVKSQSFNSKKIACPSPNKDTLYVLYEMFDSIAYIWNMPEYSKEKPILISVKDLTPYITRKEE